MRAGIVDQNWPGDYLGVRHPPDIGIMKSLSPLAPIIEIQNQNISNLSQEEVVLYMDAACSSPRKPFLRILGRPSSILPTLHD